MGWEYGVRGRNEEYKLIITIHSKQTHSTRCSENFNFIDWIKVKSFSYEKLCILWTQNILTLRWLLPSSHLDFWSHFEATDLNNFSHRCPYPYPRTQNASVLGIRELNKRLGQVIKRTICCGLPSYFLKSELIAVSMKQLQKVRRDGTWGKSDVRGKERPIRNESVALLVNKISVHIRWTVRWCLKRLKKERRLFLLLLIF